MTMTDDKFLESLPGLLSHVSYDGKGARKRVKLNGKWVTEWEYPADDSENAKRIADEILTAAGLGENDNSNPLETEGMSQVQRRLSSRT